MREGADVLPDIAGAVVDRRDLARTQASVLAGLFGVPREPTRIGRFELLGTVGSGAMGRVYAAADPRLDRRVAIKLLRPDIAAGPLAAARRRRLVVEAQALARLSHPNVVEVFEVGTEGAEVYVVMELVDGASLRQWLADAKPEPARIVEAFVAAGRGLAAAHAAGIVHRDFKPDNVLVGDDGRVRVADFGVALAAEDSTSGSPFPSRSGPTASQTMRGAAGTPGYVAPEVLREGVVDARSDQYSFCVSIVEALTGKRPQGPDEVPALPLRAATTAAILRGLREDPDARHDSMTALIEVLEGRRRGPAWVLPIVAGVGVLAGVAWIPEAVRAKASPQCRPVATLVDPIWGESRRQALRDALRADNRALGEQAWARAEPKIDTFVAAVVQRRESTCERSSSVDALSEADACAAARLADLDALIGTFERREAAPQHLVAAVNRIASTTDCEDAGHDPAVRTELVRARALVSAGSERGKALAEQVRQQAVELADTRTTIEADLVVARAEAQDGATEASLVRLRNAYFAAVELGDDPLATRAALTLGYHALSHQSDREAAQSWAEHAATHMDRTEDPTLRRTLEVQVDALLARLALDVHDGLGGLARVEQALVTLRRDPRPRPGLEARLLRMRGRALQSLGRVDEALYTLQAAHESLEMEFGTGHPNTLDASSDIATLLFRASRYNEAQVRFEQVIAGLTEAFGPDAARLGTTLTSLGATHGALGNYKAARANLLRANEILMDKLGEEHDRVANNLLNLSEVEKHLGEHDAAVRHREQAVDIRRRIFGEDSPQMVSLYNAMGQLYTSAGKAKPAIAAHNRVLEIGAKTHVEPDGTISAYLGLSRAQSLLDVELAIESLQTAMALIAELHGTRHEDYAIALTNMGALLVMAGRPEQALAPALQSLAIYEELLPPDHVDLAYGLLAAAHAEAARGLVDDAIGHAERAVSIRKRHPEVPDYMVARAELVLVRALWLSPARRGEARELADQAKSTLEAAGEDGIPGLEELAEWEASLLR